MSDSTDNTNELDSYGVWVKNTNQDGAADDDLNFADSLDLPDFEETGDLNDTDFEDMFTEDNTLNIDDSANETTLTDDELMNITSGDGIEIAEATDESVMPDDDMISDEISFDSLEENSVNDADLSGFDTEITDTPAEEISVPEVAIEEPAEEVSEESFDIVSDSGESDGSETEISLDDFMDGGFSDESVASGNNGFAADAVPAAGGSEEVSLDDFVDMSEFGVTEEAPKKDEVIADEKPLDMDISFDSSADAIQTEENLSVEDSYDDIDDEGTDAFAETTEETSVAAEEVTGSNDIDAEEVDLSDFGIDANAEETPVTQDVESAKNKESVIDYDLSVANDNTSAAPVVNEIKSTAAPVEELVEEVPEVSSADSGLLKQIVEDLSNLKSEINTLKLNLEEMKASPAPAAGSDGFISEEIAIDDDVIPDSSKEDTGFFSGDDGDDTIALSTDELSNILNTADFNTEEVTVEAADEAPEEEPVIEETPVEEEPVSDETIIDNFEAPEGNESDLTYDFTDENLSEPNIDEIEIDEESLDDDLPDEISIPKDDDILVESSSSDFMDSVQDTTEEHQTETAADDTVFEAAEEPVIEEEIVEESPVEDTFSTVDNVFDTEEAPAAIDESSGFTDIEVEEPVEPAVEDETFVPEEEVIQEEEVPVEPVIENDFVSHEDDNNNLTDSNIDYLTTEENNVEEETDENSELKKDIKSVLLYMDQLLENLPEEKIVEFAKSDEFTTYKKLFSELGLS